MKYLFDLPLHATIGTEKYSVNIRWRNGKFIADEPLASGGKDLGPDPYTLLLASLASCTLATLRMYIDRKQWQIDQIEVAANLYQTIDKVTDKMVTTIDRDLHFPVTVTEEQRKRLQEIAAACPVSKMLQGEIIVRTFTYSNTDTEKSIHYPTDLGDVVWKPELCKHSARCVSGLPEVFNVNAHPWININGASANSIMEQVGKCPTGALSFVTSKHEQTDTQ